MIIYDNYDLDSYKENAIEYFKEFYEEEPTEEELLSEIYAEMNMDWEDIATELSNYFQNDMLIVTGTLGLWNGNFDGGEIFENWESAILSMMKDCDFCRIEDNNGELCVQCSHHDGTNYFIVRKLTSRGYNLYDKWNYDYDDNRTERDIHNIIMKSNLFSNRPYVAKNIYGGK